jgi:hypothetical protein
VKERIDEDEEVIVTKHYVEIIVVIILQDI